MKGLPDVYNAQYAHVVMGPECTCPSAKKHECPFHKEVSGKNDPDWCSCCQACVQGCREDLE